MVIPEPRPCREVIILAANTITLLIPYEPAFSRVFVVGLGAWEQPAENSVQALVHGINFSDGVEFDIRMDGDGELVVYHDEFVPGEGGIADRCIESLPTSELKSKGIITFDELLSNSNFTDAYCSFYSL